MSGGEKVKMTVKFVDGSQERYSFERQITDEDALVMMKKIEDALDAKHLIVDLGSKIQLFPMNNILSIELEPPPEKLPPNCIRGALLI